MKRSPLFFFRFNPFHFTSLSMAATHHISSPCTFRLLDRFEPLLALFPNSSRMYSEDPVDCIILAHKTRHRIRSLGPTSSIILSLYDAFMNIHLI